MNRLLIILALLTGSALAQQGNTITIEGSGAPVGSCSFIFRYIDTAANNLYFCSNGTWAAAGGATGLPAGGTTPAGVPQFVTETPSGGVQGAAAWALSGVIPRASTCTANTDTILTTD